MSAASTLDRIGVGIDTARYGHRVCFLRPDLQPVAKPLTVIESRSGYRDLHERLDLLFQQHPLVRFLVRIDAAGQYATNLEHFLRGLDLPIHLSIGEPKRNRDYQKAHFPKRITDDTESQAMARFALKENPPATSPTPLPFSLLRDAAGRLQAKVKQSTQATNRLHAMLARAFPELSLLTEHLDAAWVVHLLKKYPTAQCIARAKLASLFKIPFLSEELAEQIHLVAQQSVATLQGELAETLVRDLVDQVQQTQRSERKMRDLLADAFRQLPPGAHVQVETIPGIGVSTAAVLVSKIVDIRRFATANNLVAYFGIFPHEEGSGTDKQGDPLPTGTLRMSAKGNDLARYYLWNAARSAILFNPAVAALHRRLRAKGKRGDVALGHCMRKLLHLVFAVWTTNKPFDKTHYPWDQSTDTVEASATGIITQPKKHEEAVGHKRDLPAEEVVTTANHTVAPPTPPVKPAAIEKPSAESPVMSAIPAQETVAPAKSSSAAKPQSRPQIDFAFVREQTTMEMVLRHLNLFDGLQGRGQQRRGPCPIHGTKGDGHRSFSAHLGKHIFQCFHPSCSAKGNVLDLWAAVHHLPLYDAAVNMVDTLKLQPNRNRKRNP